MFEQINVLYSHARSSIVQHSAAVVRWSFYGLVATMCFLSVLLFTEYRFFKAQTEKMIELKEDYRNYVLAVKKILNDYHITKERLEELETILVDREKKNDNEGLELLSAQTTFPEGVRVYSSDDDEEDDGNSSFLIINRELEYLKQSTLDYLKKQKLSSLMQQIGSGTWQDYTEQVIERDKAAKAKGKKRRKRCIATNRRQNQLAHQAVEAQVAQQPAGDISFMWPIDRSSFWLSSFFGPRKKPGGVWGFHKGIDMASVRGTPVRASAGGVVVEARYAQGYGKTVVIAHNQKYRTRYAHLNSINVDVGQKVDRGKLIGKVGATGTVRSKRGGDGSHLHFEVYVYGKQVNPMYFFS